MAKSTHLNRGVVHSKKSEKLEKNPKNPSTLFGSEQLFEFSV